MDANTPMNTNLLDSVNEGRAGDDLANVNQFHHDHDHLDWGDIIVILSIYIIIIIIYIILII